MKEVPTRIFADEYRAIRAEYAPGPEDDARLAAIKVAMESVLTIEEKTLMLIYAECGSYRDLGKRLGVDHLVAYRRIKKAQDKIKTYIMEAKQIETLKAELTRLREREQRGRELCYAAQDCVLKFNLGSLERADLYALHAAVKAYLA